MRVAFFRRCVEITSWVCSFRVRVGAVVWASRKTMRGCKYHTLLHFKWPVSNKSERVHVLFACLFDCPCPFLMPHKVNKVGVKKVIGSRGKVTHTHTYKHSWTTSDPFYFFLHSLSLSLSLSHYTPHLSTPLFIPFHYFTTLPSHPRPSPPTTMSGTTQPVSRMPFCAT